MKYYLLTILYLNFVNRGDALFGLFGGSKTTTTTVKPTTTTHSNPSLGREIFVSRTDEDEGGNVDIPLNDPKTTTTRRKFTDSDRATTTTPLLTKRPSVGDGVRPGVDVRGFTTSNPRFTAATKALPSSDRHSSSGCPNRIDAFSFGPDHDYAFYDHNVYIIKNDRITDTTTFDEEFPGGPKSVNGALYDLEKEIFMLISEREVYGYKKDGSNRWKLQSVFPKELPSSIAFTPESIVRWHNKHQVLLSNGGKFALYDEYWNKSLISGVTSRFFENLPDRVRGISEWRNGKAHIFTQSLVFEYEEDRKNVVGDGKPLGDFWHC